MEELLEKIQQLDSDQKSTLLDVVNQMLAEKAQKFQQQESDVKDEGFGEPLNGLYYDAQKLRYSEADIQEIVQQFPPDKNWTFQDLQNERIFPAEINVKIEIIENKIYIMPNPSTEHQQILSVINAYVQMYVLEHKLGKVYLAPTSIKFDENTVLEPDMIFVAVHRLEIVQKQSIDSAPDLVIEVISKANYKKLREAKKQIYAQQGVQEYWEIYPKKKKISISILTQYDDKPSDYQPYSEAIQNGLIKSSVLKGFELDVARVFM